MKQYIKLFEQFINESGLVSHAESELKLAGMYEADDELSGVSYNKMVADAVIELMKTFSKQGHSGFSAGMVREIFAKLSNYETLSPISSNPDEWSDVAEYGGDQPNTLWQSKRSPSTFSHDGGKTWYNLDESVLIKAEKLVLERIQYKK